MSEKSFDLKYRPKKIKDLIGQDMVCSIIENSIINKNLHHAYLFHGPSGVGKTTGVRIFAACINNMPEMSTEPDCSNPQIMDIFNGKSVDVREIDAASNRSIEDIRDIKNWIQYSPTELRYKIVIIDECHALTGAAAEAALKMIEEPPSHAIFIFATTDIHKMKETIQNRCIPLRFSKINWISLFNLYKNVCLKENLNYSDEVLKVLAKSANGVPRLGMQNLTILSLFSKSITDEKEARKILNILPEELIFEYFDNIINKNAADAIRILNSILSSGKNIGDILSDFSDYLRNIMIIGSCSDTKNILYLSEESLKKYIHHRQEISLDCIVEIIDILRDSYNEVGLNMNAQIVMEKFTLKAIVSYAKSKQQKK